MSKGHGRVMRQVLDAVRDEWTLVIHLAADLDRRTLGKRTIGRAEEAVRRACKRLADEDLVELGYLSMSTGV